jgi:hypothetical protein
MKSYFVQTSGKLSTRVQYASKEARFISHMPTICPPNTINRGDNTMEERELGTLMGPCVPCYNV